MPAAAPGQITSSTTDDTGASVTVTWFYDPGDRVLRDNPADWVAPSGTVWPAGSGALLSDNQTGRAVRAVINDADGVLLRQVPLPAGGLARTAADLAGAVPPDGPFVAVDDLNGLTFDLS